MIKELQAIIGKEKVCILGFGAEGQSSFSLLQKFLPWQQIVIADKNPALADHPLLKNTGVVIRSGDQYLAGLEDISLILKSPGIPFTELSHIPAEHLSSQADLFIRYYRRQIIGITGTKGKSTTTSLIYHIIRQQTENALLVGNIGVPPFDHLEEIDAETLIVYELSSHQLEHITCAPRTSLLLNLYEEHLDHYHSKEDYFLAKMNIALHQAPGDLFIYNAEDTETMRLMKKLHLQGTLLPVTGASCAGPCCYPDQDELVLQSAAGDQLRFDATLNQSLIGEHNRKNMLFAIAAVKANGIQQTAINQGLRTFLPLAHRLQYVGIFQHIAYYNDSIATIPEATIAAVKAIPNIGTLILGGFDRGIDYHGLASFLASAGIDNLVFLGAAGKRMLDLIKEYKISSTRLFEAKDMTEAVGLAKQQTAPGKVCLLSPAAASYDMFKNFEERGAVFMQLVSS